MPVLPTTTSSPARPDLALKHVLYSSSRLCLCSVAASARAPAGFRPARTLVASARRHEAYPSFAAKPAFLPFAPTTSLPCLHFRLFEWTVVRGNHNRDPSVLSRLIAQRRRKPPIGRSGRASLRRRPVAGSRKTVSYTGRSDRRAQSSAPAEHAGSSLHRLTALPRRCRPVHRCPRLDGLNPMAAWLAGLVHAPDQRLLSALEAL